MANGYQYLTPGQVASAGAPGAPAAAPAAGTAAPAPGKLEYLTPDQAQQRMAGPQQPAKAGLGMFGGKAPEKMGWLPWLGERGIEIAGAAGGGALGGLLGTAAAPGVGTVAGGIAGEAMGLTAADWANAKLNQAFYGAPEPDVSTGSVAKDLAVNTVGAGIGAGLGAVVPKAVSSILGKPALRDAVGDVVGDAASKLDAAKAAMGAHPQDIMADARQTVDASIDKLIKPELKGAREEAIQSTLGRTPAETRATTQAKGIVGPTGEIEANPAITDRRAKFYDTMFGIEGRMRKNLGQQFEDVFKDHVGNEIDAASISDQAKQLLPGLAPDAENYAQQYASRPNQLYSAKTNDLLNEAVGFGKKSEARTAYFAKVDAEAQRQLQRAAARGNPVTPEQARELGLAFLSGQEVHEPEANLVGHVLGYRSRLGQAIQGADGPDRAALSMMRHEVDDALTNTGVPGAAELRAKYAGFKKDFGKDYLRSVGTVSEPSVAMRMLFDPTHPQRAMLWAQAATDEEKPFMRELYTDAVHSKFVTPNQMHAGVLEEMGFPSKGGATNPDAWIYNEHVIPQLDQVFDTSPQAHARIVQARDAAAMTRATENWQGLIKDAEKHIPNLGDEGLRIKAAMDAAPTVEAKANIAMKQILGIDKDQFPKDQAIKALMTYNPKEGPIMQAMKRRAVNGLMLAPPIIGVGAAMGRPAMGLGLGIGGVLAGAASLGTGLIRRAYMSTMTRSPEAAAAFFEALRNPGTTKSLNTFGKSIVDGSMADFWSKLGHPAAGALGYQTALAPSTGRQQWQTLNPDFLANTPGANQGGAAAALDRMNAQQIAGRNATPERIDMIQDMSHQLSLGATPTIDTGLRSGQLSTPAIKMMLTRMNPRNAANMMKYMGPDDRNHLLAMASPEEREWLAPLSR